MKLGRSPALALVLFGCTSTHPDPAPATASKATACHVEIAIESSEGKSLVDLGPGSCTKRQNVAVARGHHGNESPSTRSAGESYFVALSVSGSLEQPLVSSDVVRVSKDLAPGDAQSRTLLRALTEGGADVGLPPVLDAPPPHTRLVVPGEWSEIAAGEWSDAEAYRVFVRVARGAT